MKEIWSSLFDLADQLKLIAPWDSMYEDELFGVQDPETGEIGIMSIMGHNGEHFAIARYPGSYGLHTFKKMYEASGDSIFDQVGIIMSNHQLQLSWEMKMDLEKHDLALIKKVGKKYRRSPEVLLPRFQSVDPGFLPWMLPDDQCPIFKTALEQTIEVISRPKNERKLKHGKDKYLVRVCKEGQWEDQIQTILPEEPPIKIVSRIPKLESLQKITRRIDTVELMLQLTPIPLSEKKGRPYFPMMLFMVDPASRMILHFELLAPLPSLEAAWGAVAEKIAEVFHKQNLLPANIKVDSKILKAVMTPLASSLDIKLHLVSKLKAGPAIFEQIMSSMTSGFNFE